MTRQIVVIELEESFPRRVADKPHVYVCATSRDPDAQLTWLKAGNGPDWIACRVVRARPELVFNYQPNSRVTTIKRRLKETKERLIREGYAVNGFTTTWRVYVLDVDPNPFAPDCANDPRGRVVYVGQTSKPLDIRLHEHLGERLGRRGQSLTAPSIKGMHLRLNSGLTPPGVFFTEEEAKASESTYARQLEARGFEVRGDGLTR